MCRRMVLCRCMRCYTLTSGAFHPSYTIVYKGISFKIKVFREKVRNKENSLVEMYEGTQYCRME